MKWLHQGCDSDLSTDFLNFGAGNFPVKIPFEKRFIFLKKLWRRRDPVLELQFLTPLRVVLLRFAAQSLQLLGAAAACVILLSFAAGHRKSYWSGCIKLAIMICQQIFSILALNLFFFALDPVLELQFV